MTVHTGPWPTRSYGSAVQEVLSGVAEDMLPSGLPSWILPSTRGSRVHERSAGCIWRIL